MEPGLEGDLRLQHILDVSSAIDIVVGPGATVASFWPGFVFQLTPSRFRGSKMILACP